MKKKRKIEILWIDDEKNYHLEDATNLEYANKALTVRIVHPSNLNDELLKIKTTKKSPDLFLVDYFLDQVRNSKDGRFNQRGLTVSGMIREIEPERPIYVVTQRETKIGGVFLSGARAAKDYFDRTLSFKTLQRQGPEILYCDALDYKAVRESARRNFKVLFDLLRVNGEIIDKLGLVIPDELRNGLSPIRSNKQPEGNAIAFTRWVREVLLSVPGFLYDELHASTHLGMRVSSFKRIQTKLRKAKYFGIFSATSPDLWWVSRLNEIVFSTQIGRRSTKTNPWAVAPEVFKTPKKELSKCAVCGDLSPEIVGINLKDEKDLRPVHYRCSTPHPKRRRELYFDEPRAFEMNNIS